VISRHSPQNPHPMSVVGLTPEVQAFKDDGNKNFRVAEYLKAAAAYTKALKLAERDGSEPYVAAYVMTMFSVFSIRFH
jgi:hypothetical protein